MTLTREGIKNLVRENEHEEKQKPKKTFIVVREMKYSTV
jgi:hypothetical protein